MKKLIGIISLWACFYAEMASAGLTVASPFTDHAVLQREMAVPIWGTAGSGASVTVEFAGQKKSVIAGADGKWLVKLDSMPATSEPQKLRISDSESELSFTNLVVGEVWICSGQSNMQMGYEGIPDIKELVPGSKNIRAFEVKRTVAFEEQDHCEGQWSTQPPKSAVAFAFAHYLEKASDVPVGIILTCWGSSSLEAWMPRDMVETVPHFRTMMKEFDADSKTRARIAGILEGQKPWSRNDDIFLRRQTNILYNAMMHPLAPYGCRGLVWYQGERNTQSMHGMLKAPWYSRNSGMLRYGETLKKWVRRYRKEWGNEEMHFLMVMLPGYHKPMKTGPKLGAKHPASHSWAWMRESQLKVLELPHTGVANTIDLGDVKNVHPKDKGPVGQRLALLAARNTLEKDVMAEGPILKKSLVQDKKVVVHFKNGEGLKTLDGKSPRGFWLSGDDQKWAPAKARIEGEKVVLISPDLPKPKYVRYAFAGKPDVNLVNAAGLPASPFRTDKFKP